MAITTIRASKFHQLPLEKENTSCWGLMSSLYIVNNVGISRLKNKPEDFHLFA